MVVCVKESFLPLMLLSSVRALVGASTGQDSTSYCTGWGHTMRELYPTKYTILNYDRNIIKT